MSVSKNRKEQAGFAGQDAKVLKELAEELRLFNWEVNSCGRDGQAHLDKAQYRAKDAIKRLVNYI